MPRNGAGTYTLPAGNPVVTGTTISSTVQNNTMSDVATALTSSIAKDGQTVPTANLPMGGYKHTGVANASNLTDYAAYGQLMNSSAQYLTGVSGTDTITASLSGLTAYAAGQVFRFIVAGANTGTSVTIDINSLGTKSITKNGTSALAIGDIPVNAAIEIIYDGTRFQLIGTAANVANTVTGAVASGATGTTQSQGDNSTKIATTAYVDAASAPIRQTVLSGPVDSSGFSAFGGSTGSATVTASGTLKATAAAGGSANYIGSITNPSWAGLSTNGTMYLYLDITSAGVVTTGSTTLSPVYQWGGTYSTTNLQNTFNIQEMTMKVGNGSTASQVFRVFVGEVTVSGNVVTVITWYALMGRYDSGYTNTLPGVGVATNFNHKLGIVPGFYDVVFKCITTDAGFSVGDVSSDALSYDATTYSKNRYATSLTGGFTCGSANTWYLPNKSTGAQVHLTSANWAYKFIANRGW